MAEVLVLAVDDEELSLDLLAQALEIFGYKTRTAENGRVALEMLKIEKPDIIITDIYMPEMNGIELLREIRQNYKDIPVILITGFDAEEARKAANDYHADALLLKPFQIVELRDIIESLVPS